MLDTVEAPRYVVKDRRNDIYIPLEHFRVDLSRVVSVSFHGFWTKEVVTVYSVEIVNGLPEGVKVPGKVENGRMVLRCSRENAFAFGIDDGDPRFARQIMDILEEEKVFVTFFVVANGLRDESTNFSSVYREMRRRGHQIALHSDSHPKYVVLLSSPLFGWNES